MSDKGLSEVGLVFRELRKQALFETAKSSKPQAKADGQHQGSNLRGEEKRKHKALRGLCPSPTGLYESIVT